MLRTECSPKEKVMSVCLSLKDLDAAIGRLAQALSKEQQSEGKKYARDLCICCRFVHMDVWTYCPDYDYVNKEIITLMHRAQEEIDKLVLLLEKQQDKEGAKEVTIYKKNIGLRITNLQENYVQGKVSAFVPDSKISEPKSVAS